MSKSNISSRRQIITGVLLMLAVGGGLVRWLAPDPSLARDMGSLLLVLWLPIVGNIIAWLIQRAKTPSQPMGFADGAAFERHAQIEITLLPPPVPQAARPIRVGLFPCILVVGSEGFTARLHVPSGHEPEPGVPATFDAQFLRAETAGPKLPAGTKFTLLAGRTPIAQGQVLEAGLR
jgi:hypothetical protein